jgi:DNA-binding MarR family transcriptional regulator
MHDERLANLLGAAALAVSDRMLADVRDTGRVSASGAAALVVLAHEPGLGATELGRRVGLSQPATARMVDTLAAAGLVRRGSGQGRTVPVTLTSSGVEMVREILAARTAGLGPVLAGLDRGERRALAGLLEKLLARLYGQVGNSELLCRLCDRACCTRRATCPVGQAERDQAS